MVKIMLVCCAGMSTGLLVQKMEQAAKDGNYDCKIWATSEAQHATEYEKEPADIIMVGPQIRYLIPKIKETVQNKIPVELIEMRTYGMMNGKKVLETAYEVLSKNK